jgi:hypothetical protein
MYSQPSQLIDRRTLAGSSRTERKPFGASERCFDAGSGTRGDVS